MFVDLPNIASNNPPSTLWPILSHPNNFATELIVEELGYSQVEQEDIEVDGQMIPLCTAELDQKVSYLYLVTFLDTSPGRAVGLH